MYIVTKEDRNRKHLFSAKEVVQLEGSPQIAELSDKNKIKCLSESSSLAGGITTTARGNIESTEKGSKGRTQKNKYHIEL